VTDLVRQGIVDDERFAAALGHMMVAVRGYGRERARRELERHGLAGPAIEAMLEDLAPLAGEDDRASAVARRIRRPSDDAERLAARLVRRGFSSQTALRAARRVARDASDSDENLL
jgi:SOS response regulatory protein OraA/RecX